MKVGNLRSYRCDEIAVDHVVSLDGFDQGAAVIEIGPSGKIFAVRAQCLADAASNVELTAVPLLADSHVHLGISDGVTQDAKFHNLRHTDAQLRHLAIRGVGHVHSLGTDQRWLLERLRKRLAGGDAGERAFGYSAAIGFGAINGWPPEMTSPDVRFRPQEPELARQQVRELAGLGCQTLKIWIDDFGNTVPKIPFNVVRAIIDEARQCGIVSFAHVYSHDDAEALVSFGIGVLAHSVRDRVMEEALIEQMGAKGVTLVPTLSREEAEFAFSLDDNPYMKNQFFVSSERESVPRLHEQKVSGDLDAPKRRLEIAMENLARVHQAGIPVGLGTDSGFKLKLLGFAQHRELQLMNRAGMSPAECLRAGLRTNQRLFATALTEIAMGELASFFIVEGNPLKDIRATENIRQVWVCGKRLSGSDVAVLLP